VDLARGDRPEHRRQARQGHSSQLGPVRGIAARDRVLDGERRGAEQRQRRGRRAVRLPQRPYQVVEAAARGDPHVRRRDQLGLYARSLGRRSG
jgi:hypothetical protein